MLFVSLFWYGNSINQPDFCSSSIPALNNWLAIKGSQPDTNQWILFRVLSAFLLLIVVALFLSERCRTLLILLALNELQKLEQKVYA